MIKPKILVQGSFQPEDIEISISSSNLSMLEEIKLRIEETWDKKIKEANEKDLHLYNGNSYRLNNYKHENGKIYLDFGIIDYKTRYSLGEILPKMDFDESMYRNGCFVGATVKTSDDKYLMVRLSGKSMNKNKYELLGGMMETNIETDSEYIFNVLRTELREEAGIQSSEINRITLRAVYQSSRTNIGFYLEVELSVTSSEILKRFESNNDVDIEGIEVYSYEEYLEVLRDHDLNKQLIHDLI